MSQDMCKLVQRISIQASRSINWTPLIVHEWFHEHSCGTVPGMMGTAVDSVEACPFHQDVTGHETKGWGTERYTKGISYYLYAVGWACNWCRKSDMCTHLISPLWQPVRSAGVFTPILQIWELRLEARKWLAASRTYKNWDVVTQVTVQS